MEIRGPTLVLRYATADDVDRLFELGREAEVVRFFSWGPYETVDEAAAYVAGLPEQREAGRLLDFVIDHHELGVVGVTGLGEHATRDRRAIVGTWLGRPYWGSGANAESKALICALAFGPLGLGRLGAYSSPGNARSQRALEGLGFRREGELRAWHRHGDAVHDVLIYGLLRAEWAIGPMRSVEVEIAGEAPGAYRP